MANLFMCEYGKVSALVGKLSDAGLTDGLAEQVLKNPDLATVMVQALKAVLEKPHGSEMVFTLTVDCSQTLTDMIAAGKYDWVDKNITPENFPLEPKEGIERVEVVLVHLDKVLTTDQVKVELDRKGLKPATIVELLALGAAHPDLQREFPVMALGSAWRDPDGNLYSPYLYEDGDQRDLLLHWCNAGSRWGEDSRFLAVRK